MPPKTPGVSVSREEGGLCTRPASPQNDSIHAGMHACRARAYMSEGPVSSKQGGKGTEERKTRRWDETPAGAARKEHQSRESLQRERRWGQLSDSTSLEATASTGSDDGNWREPS
ncbi:hypothetical protein JX266_009093 [Neoarthrinium moseri]|nr:hypothetical protein JX266_009093 [Neoarthrinium moseri]